MNRTTLFTTILAVLLALGSRGLAQLAERPHGALPAAPVHYWSHETRRAIVPAGPNGIFGMENYGNKFPGEAAVYMGLVHLALYDAATALAHSPRLDASARTTAETPSPEATIATAAYRTLVGLQPALGLTPAQEHLLSQRYEDYLARIDEGRAKTSGIALGARTAAALLGTRANDGREADPRLADLRPPAAGPGVWDPGIAPALGLRLPGMRPLVLETASQFRPDGPSGLSSEEYAEDFREVKDFGALERSTRTPGQTSAALFWTDHDLRQWNDGLLGLASAQGLDLVQTAKMLAMAHAAGGDAMIACFDAKYAFWFWRPYQAIVRAEADGNVLTHPDPAWRPLAATPNFPEYPSAHSCHSAALVEALSAFFKTDRIRFSLDSRITGTTRVYARLRDVVREVESARVLAGFHFRNSDVEGSRLGRRVSRYVVVQRFKTWRHPLTGTR